MKRDFVQEVFDDLDKVWNQIDDLICTCTTIYRCNRCVYLGNLNQIGMKFSIVVRDQLGLTLVKERWPKYTKQRRIEMAKMTEEEMKRYYEKEPRRDTPSGDIEQLEGEALLDEMEMRSHQALARCAVALDEFYPCFEKTIEIKLRDVKDRIPDQAIGCEAAAHLTKDKKHTVPEQKRVARALRNLKLGEAKDNEPADD